MFIINNLVFVKGIGGQFSEYGRPGKPTKRLTLIAMSFYRKITSLVQPSKNTVSFTEAEKAFRQQQEDLSKVGDEENGPRNTLPEFTNFYASLKCKDPGTILSRFEEPAWAIRKAGQTEWEMTSSWAQLHLEPDHEGFLLNGLVAYHPDNGAILNQLLDRIGVSYRYELYDAEKNLLLEKSFP